MRSTLAVLFPLLICLLLPATVAQNVQITYTVHVDFYAFACSLDIKQVSLYDQSGRLLGVASSPYGGEIAITFTTTSSSIQSVTAAAFGQATLGSYYSWAVSGTRTINLGSGGDYWITVRLS
jgi:hypothetical protein